MDAEDERVPKMGEIQIRVKPEFYLNKAREENLKENIEDAYKYYVHYVECLSNPLEEMSNDDYFAMTNLALKVAFKFEDEEKNEFFKIEEKKEDNPKNKNKVIRCYLQILNHFPKNCKILNALGVYLCHQLEFKIAQKYLVKASNEGYLPAQRNLVYVNWRLIPRWYYRLLNDKYRNECYKKAIMKALQKGPKEIIDIGAGFGFLSMVASIFQKDIIITAYEKHKILFDMGKEIIYENKMPIQFINAHSAKCRASVPFNLILFDIFDAALLGDGNTLYTINHSLRTFVTADPNHQIIPKGATMYVTGFQSEKLQNDFRFTKTFKRLKLENVCLKVISFGQYDAEYLGSENINFLTETTNFQTFDFYDKEYLLSLMVSKHDERYKDAESIDLKVMKDGTLTSLAVWYDLHLDEEIKISTSPNDPNNRFWEQAIYHLPHPINVKRDDIVTIKPSFDGLVLTFKIESPVVNCRKCFYVSSDIITFLNDSELTGSISQVVDSIKDCDNKTRVLDFNEFPLFGFLMGLKGANVHHVYRNNEDLVFLEHVMEINNISKTKFILISEKTAVTTKYMSYLKKWDYVYSGLMRFEILWDRLCREMPLSHEIEQQSLPQKILLKTQLIQSDYLDLCNKVNDDNVFNFKIAKYMNKYSGDEHPLGLNSLKYESYSEEVTFDVSDVSNNYLTLETKVTKDGEINGILIWYEMEYFEGEDIRFCTFNSGHYKKNCSYLSEPKKVKEGDLLNIYVYRDNCYLTVYCY